MRQPQPNRAGFLALSILCAIFAAGVLASAVAFAVWYFAQYP